MTKYEECGIKERELLRKVFSKYKGNQIDIEYSPVNGYEIWDAKLFINGNGYLFECKIRDFHYNELMLEKKKYDDLIKYAKENDFKRVYFVNETTEGVYISRLDDLDINNLTIQYKKCPVSTMDLSKGYKDKAFYGLEIGKEMKKINL
jgi:hypothetical protein